MCERLAVRERLGTRVVRALQSTVLIVILLAQQPKILGPRE